MIAESLRGLLDDGVQELAISKPEAISLPTSNVVSAATLSFEGLFATQQSGIVPVEGAIYFFAAPGRHGRLGACPVRAGRSRPARC